MGKWLLIPECFTLIKNLQYAEELSFINLSIIKYSLTSINHFELLQECLKLRITVAIIIECYLKSKYVGGFRQGTCAMLADDNINIAEYLLSTRENNHDKFNEEIENLKQDSDIHNFINRFKLYKGSQLSWPVVTSHLMIIGELNVSYKHKLRGWLLRVLVFEDQDVQLNLRLDV